MTPPCSDRALLERLVSFDSVSARSNRAIAEFAAGVLEEAGATVELTDYDDGAKVNLLARLGPEGAAPERGLVLCGHLDVVPADEPEWTTDPFTLVEDEGCYWGRGACDMKGFVALALAIASGADAATLRAPLVLVLTADEEIGSVGAQRFVETRRGAPALPRAVIIGEPTSLRAVRMHKGHLKLRITVRGAPAHSGSPHLGRHAIEPAAAIVVALGDLRRALTDERGATSAAFPTVPYAALNVARMHGGTAVNVIPERCVIDVGARPLPGDDVDRLRERIEEAVRGAVAGADVEVEVALVNANPPMLLDADAPVYRALCAAIGQTRDHGVSFSSDGGVLMRDLGHECVLFGPGAIEVAHRPNEFVPIDEMHAARRTVEAMVHRFCREPEA